MTVLFGAHGLSATLATDAVHGLLGRMSQCAGSAAIELLSTPCTSFSGTDGAALGVTQRCRPGEVAQEVHARAPGLWLAMQGRFDARADLAQRLGLAIAQDSQAVGGPSPRVSDAALAMAAYQQFGADCVQHLYGDWVFALWDASQQRLLLARDATGNSALFWWKGGGQLLFASSLPTLLAAGPVPMRPNRRWLAGLLTAFTDPAYPGATAFEDVHAVPPGHLLIAERGDVSLQRWWWPEKLAPLDNVPLPELEARVLSLYNDAVRCCLHRESGSVALTLSAGLDSGSVAALAAPALAEQGQRLVGYVHTPRFNPTEGEATRTLNEWPLAQATARFVGNVDTVACPTDQWSPIDGLRQWLDTIVVPSHAASNWYWLLDIAQRASADGAAVLLTGQGGNSTVSYSGTGDLRRLFRRNGVVPVLEELGTDASGLLPAFRDRLVKPALRPGWHGIRRAWAAATRRKPGGFDFGLLSPALARDLSLDEAMAVAGHDPTHSTTSPSLQQQFRLSLLAGADNGLAVWSELGWTHGLSIRDPTRDRRLVELCWRMPDEVFWGHGLGRSVIRHGLRHRLPPEVLACTRKGLQASDLRMRLQDCKADFLGQVDVVCQHPLARQCLDTERLTAVASAIAGNGPLTQGAVDSMRALRALAAGMFIVRHA